MPCEGCKRWCKRFGGHLEPSNDDANDKTKAAWHHKHEESSACLSDEVKGGDVNHALTSSVGLTPDAMKRRQKGYEEL